MTQEVTIYTDAWVQPWNVQIGNPRDHPPVVLFMADDIHLALRQGRVTWPSRETLTVTPEGFATVGTTDERRVIYELFPAKFSDEQPYEPLVYVGRRND